MTVIIPTIVQISVALLGCDGQMISPYGIDDEEDILRVSNSEVICLQDHILVNIMIYIQIVIIYLLVRLSVIII